MEQTIPTDPRHRIHRQVFEITIPDPAMAWQIQNRLSNVQRQRLEPLISRCLSECCKNEDGLGPELHRIDSLVVDLGILDLAQLEDDLVEALGPALRQAVAGHLVEAAQTTAAEEPDDEGGESPVPSQLELLECFLETGTLPWWADPSQPEVLETALVSLIRQAPRDLSIHLRHLHAETSRRRLVLNTRDTTLADLAVVLCPNAGLTATLVLETLNALLGNESQTPWDRQVFWQAVLSSTNRGSSTPKEFWRELLTRLAAALGKPPNPWLSKLLEAHVEGKQPLPMALAKRLEEYAPPSNRQLVESKATPSGSPGSLDTDPDRPPGRSSRETPWKATDGNPGTDAPSQEPTTNSKALEATGPKTKTPASKVGTHGAHNRENHRHGTKLETYHSLVTVDSPDEVSECHWRDTPKEGTWLPLGGTTPMPPNPRMASRAEKSLVEKIQAGKNPPWQDQVGRNLTRQSQTEKSPDRQDPDRPGQAPSHTAPSRQGQDLLQRTKQPITRDPARGERGALDTETAGLVLLWPFLITFFDRLGLVSDGQFSTGTHQQRAVALVHYLATEEPSPPEYQVTLAKVLCGLEPEEVFDAGLPITSEEAEECTSLLHSVVEHATILNDMSLPGLRATFLGRRGILQPAPGAWLLRVERQTYDVVLDQFPWSREWVKLPFMTEPLQVDW